MMHGHEKSDLVIVAMKPANKAKEAHCGGVCGGERSGVGGAKGGGQGEYAPAQHVLDPEPGSRDKRAGAYTATFAVTHPRWEPYAGKPHVRFCAGGRAMKRTSLPLQRREFITLLGGAAAAWPLPAWAQQTPGSITSTRIAFLGAESASTNQHFSDAFRQGMREHGYVDGQNITLVERWAEGRSERFPELIEELISLKANVILAVSVPAAIAAKTATTAIPIVFIASDPLGSGLVRSLARPGGNLTGFSLFLGDEFSSKWLELLKEAVPNASRVAILWNPVNPASSHYVTVLRDAGEKLGVMLQPQAVSDPDQFDGAFATIVAERAQALIVVVDPLTVRYRERLVELAVKNRLPAMFGFREFIDAGGLIAYGVNVPYLCRRAAVYVDKIIKGANPAELPVEQPTRFELVINLKTAKALGIEIPPMLLARADEVIE